MEIFNKIKDVLKEVFWLKSRDKKKSSSRRKRTVSVKSKKKITPVKKKIAKTKAAPKAPLKVIPKQIKAPKVKLPILDPALVQAGEITHYFDRIKVCVVKITHGSILIGDRLTIKSSKVSFVQKVWSMQIESKDVKVARKGELIGIKVDRPVAAGDIVYK